MCVYKEHPYVKPSSKRDRADLTFGTIPNILDRLPARDYCLPFHDVFAPTLEICHVIYAHARQSALSLCSAACFVLRKSGFSFGTSEMGDNVVGKTCNV